jgi:hypothetical protein
MLNLPNVTLEALRADAWVTSQAEILLSFGGAFLGGGEEGRLWFGYLAVGILTVVSLVMIYWVASQVWTVAVTLVKIVVGLGVAVFAGLWARKLWGFIHAELPATIPPDSQRELEEMAWGAWSLGKWWYEAVDRP